MPPSLRAVHSWDAFADPTISFPAHLLLYGFATRRDIVPHIAAGMLPLGTGQMTIDIKAREFVVVSAARYSLAARHARAAVRPRLGSMAYYIRWTEQD